MGGARGYCVSRPATKHPLHNECGIIAISDLLGNQPHEVWDDLKDKNKDLSKYILNKYKEGLSFIDLTNIVKSLNPNLSVDFRLNSHRRDMTGNIFQSGDIGIAALKFKDIDDTHWVALKDGTIHLAYNVYISSIEELYTKDNRFDGIGHKLIFRSKADVESLRNTYSVKCTEELCDYCCRNGACADQNCK